jgi:ferredoxin-NADP reductase
MPKPTIGLRLPQLRRPMERAAVRRRLTWQLARVVELVAENARTTSLVLQPADWPGHRAGQHVDVRLTAEDGYQAQRSYSIASAPEDEHLVLTVERLDDGEVSPYLTETLRPGDELELRGPVGGYFVWEESLGGPLLLVGGGSGVVPLRAMLRYHRAVGSDLPARLLYSARTQADLIYQRELSGFDTTITLTREQWAGRTGRVDRELLEEVAWPATDHPLVYVCGPTGFAEAVADALVALGHDASRVRTERFGPT